MNIAEHYDQLALLRKQYLNKNKYYYALLYKEYKYFIPEGKKILEVGCGTGELLAVLKPSLGVGVDISPRMIYAAQDQFPTLQFFAGEISDIKISCRKIYPVLFTSGVELKNALEYFHCLFAIVCN